MRTTLIIACLFVTATGKSQSSVSTWFDSTYLPRFYVDTGTYLPPVTFTDVQGQEKKLDDFSGKFLYISLWATTCGNSVRQFPYQKQLLKRLQEISLDTAIQFINIHVEDSKKEWKTSLKKYQPTGINLFCADKAILSKWNLNAPPAYILLDRSGKVLGKKISLPEEAVTIDYILYAAVKDMSPADALLKQHRQLLLLEEFKTPDAFTDTEYKNWYQLTIKSFLDYRNWKLDQQ
jgi:hypothetical protein